MRWVLRAVFALVVLALLAAGAVMMLPAERIAGLAVAEFRRLTGRELVLTGASAPSFWPTFGIRTGPVSMSNADWSDRGPMLEAEALDITVDMAALLGGEVKIRSVEAVGPVIRLERNAEGAANWEFGGGGSDGAVTTETPGVGKPFTLDRALLSGGRLLYADAATGQTVELTDLDGTIEIPDFAGPARIALSGRRGGQDFTADVTLGAFQPFLDGAEVEVGLALAAGPATVRFDGTATRAPMSANGRIDADFGDLKAISALAGLDPPALPQGFGARTVAVRGDLRLAEGPDVTLTDASVTLDGTPYAVAARLTPGAARPMLAATVEAGALDLGGGESETGAAGAAPAGSGGWPDDSIDVSALNLIDADVALKTGPVRLGPLRLDAASVHLVNDRGRLVADLNRVAAYGGTIAGQMVVNGRTGLSTSGDLVLSGIALEPLLTDLAGYGRLNGTGDLRLKYLASGRSVAEMMQSLDGEGTLSVGQGELVGLDLAAMLVTLDASKYGAGRKTIFDSLSASFKVADGVLTNDDLLLVSPRVTARGQGRVGLGARDLDYRVRATALADDQGQGGLSAPVRITGSWAKPRFSVDMEALAEEEMNDDLSRAEDEANQKLEEELGIERQEGESLEDAARRKAEEALQKELGDALLDLLNQN